MHEFNGKEYITGWAADVGPTIGGFNPSLFEINYPHLRPSWSEALERKLPPICWFRTDASVRFAGCSTRDVAHDMTEYLRGDAVSYGTTMDLTIFPGPPKSVGYIGGYFLPEETTFEVGYTTTSSLHRDDVIWYEHYAKH